MIMHPFLQHLLAGQAVEWKPLGDLAVIKTGQAVSKQMISDNSGQYPVINSGREPLGFIDTWNTDNDPIGITTRGAGVGSITWQEGRYYRGNLNYSVTIKDNLQLNVRFLYHVLLQFQHEIHALCSFSGIPALNASELKKLYIPIPPLSVQTKIAQILDTMTAITAELTAELNMRNKQYQYYRDKLLSENELAKVGFEWKTLGEICLKVSSGGTPLSTREEYYNGDIPWLRTQEVKFNEIFETEVKITQAGLDNSSAKWIPANCVIVAISGATAGRSAINKIPLTTNQHCCNLQINPEIALYKYVYYWVLKEFENIKSLGQGARSDLNSGIIKNYQIPIPPLAEQARIVAILDKFDTLTQSITEGLPREIELRQKQYEYYRERLLGFGNE